MAPLIIWSRIANDTGRCSKMRPFQILKFSIVLQYIFIRNSYISNVNKFIVLLAIISTMGVMLAMSSAYIPTHVAKASTCTSQFSIRGLQSSQVSTTKPGACSSGAAASQSVGRATTSFLGAGGSSCTSLSSTSRPGFGFLGSDIQSNNGAVSCSSHSP